MTDEEMAEKYVTENTGFNSKEPLGKIAVRTYLTGLKAGKEKAKKEIEEELLKCYSGYPQEIEE